MFGKAVLKFEIKIFIRSINTMLFTCKGARPAAVPAIDFVFAVVCLHNQLAMDEANILAIVVQLGTQI